MKNTGLEEAASRHYTKLCSLTHTCYLLIHLLFEAVQPRTRVCYLLIHLLSEAETSQGLLTRLEFLALPLLPQG